MTEPSSFLTGRPTKDAKETNALRIFFRSSALALGFGAIGATILLAAAKPLATGLIFLALVCGDFISQV